MLHSIQLFKTVLLVLLISSCSNGKTPKLSEINSRYVEGENYHENYDSGGCSDISKKIKFNITHESLNLIDFKSSKLKISWGGSIFYDQINSDEVNVDIKFCKSDLRGRLLSFQLFDFNDSIIYIWGVKKNVNLWEQDEYDVMLLENSDYKLN